MTHDEIPASEADLFALMRRELSSAVVGDVMDRMGLQHQFLPPRIQPLRDDMVLVGRAMPVLTVDVYAESLAGTANSLMERPYGLLFEALDALRPHDVYVCTGGSPRYALWGELLTARAIRLGAAGAVLNGYVRDTRGILRQDFSTFCVGRYAQDLGPRGKVVDYGVPIEIDGVRIEPGDVIFGDMDGVCIVPRDAERDVVAQSLLKVRDESLVRRAFEDGVSASEAYKRFQVM